MCLNIVCSWQWPPSGWLRSSSTSAKPVWAVELYLLDTVLLTGDFSLSKNSLSQQSRFRSSQAGAHIYPSRCKQDGAGTSSGRQANGVILVRQHGVGLSRDKHASLCWGGSPSIGLFGNTILFPTCKKLVDYALMAVFTLDSGMSDPHSISTHYLPPQLVLSPRCLGAPPLNPGPKIRIWQTS